MSLLRHKIYKGVCLSSADYHDLKKKKQNIVSAHKPEYYTAGTKEMSTLQIYQITLRIIY